MNDNQTIFPVITLYQPWADWVMRKWKPIETRTHNRFACLDKKHILIHAGQKTDPIAFSNPFLSPGQLRESSEGIVKGCILGSAFVYNFNQLTAKHSFQALIDCSKTKRYGLFLTDIKVFDEPIPCQGSMGIWYYDLENRVKVGKPRKHSLIS